MIEERLQNSSAIRELARELRGAKASHAYLIISPDATVRKCLSEMIASFVLCRQGGCGECPVCFRIKNGSHGDVKIYNTNNDFKVKEAESLISDTYMKGIEGKAKLYFIESANTVSAVVQNKLLKIYEEPPENVTLFLLAPSEAGLLTTILSRARKLYVPLFGTDEIFEELTETGVDRAAAEAAAVFAAGRFDRAFAYAENEEYTYVYREAFKTLIGCKKSAFVSAYMGKDIFAKEKINLTLEFFEIILRDVLEYLTGGDNYMTVNRDYDIKTIADGFSAGGAAMAISSVERAREKLQSNVNALSVAESVLFDILEDKYKWQ